MKQTIQSTLQSVGIFCHYCGYPYFIRSITLAAEDPRRLQNIREEIYLPIARLYQTNLMNVEKNLRTIRDVMMKNGGTDLLAKMAGVSFWENKMPYPREIIEIFAEYFAEELTRKTESVSESQQL